ncbi:MAG: hypothetical protein C5B51_30010 [Terriglobia bacterium]|nr:MAG: hypothetical protein C5B51_30010 [Terriglobia bacterium]
MQLKKTGREWVSALGFALIAALPAAAQDFEVFTPVQHDVSPPLRDLAKIVSPAAPGQQQTFFGPIDLPASAPGPDTALQHGSLPYTSIVTSPGFQGLGVGFPGFTVQFAPPDTNATVGPNHVIQWVNASFAIFNKAGTLIQGPTPGNAPWAGFGGGCQTNNDGDPIVQYDKAADRWIFTQFSVSTKPYLQCFAVSTSSDPTGTYNRYAFSFGNTNFPDYPKLGVWPDGYYMSFNIFARARRFKGPDACVIDRATALAGGAATMQCFQQTTSVGSLLPSDLDGSTPPPAGSRNYFATFATNSLNVYGFHADFANPANSSFTLLANIPVASFSPACGGGTCIPQAGTSQQLDSLADRLMYRLAYRNRAGTESLVVNHSITTSAPSGIRWYELRVSGGMPSLFQQGTYSPDTTSRWMGSIAMDKCGDIMVGYSASSSSINPAIRVNGRAPTDPLGQLQTEVSVVAGTGSQTGGLNRWGDYSSMAVDPSDDKTFWYTTEYIKANGSFNWSTWIVPITFPGCN